jgi:hypothetical protein
MTSASCASADLTGSHLQSNLTLLYSTIELIMVEIIPADLHYATVQTNYLIRNRERSWWHSGIVDVLYGRFAPKSGLAHTFRQTDNR